MIAGKPLYAIFAVMVLALIGATSVVFGQIRQASETEIRLDSAAKRFDSIHASTAFNQTQGH
jgi:hypothetical protein